MHWGYIFRCNQEGVGLPNDKTCIIGVVPLPWSNWNKNHSFVGSDWVFCMIELPVVWCIELFTYLYFIISSAFYSFTSWNKILKSPSYMHPIFRVWLFIVSLTTFNINWRWLFIGSIMTVGVPNYRDSIFKS